MVWWRERSALERKCGRREGGSGVLGRGLVALLILWFKCGDIKWNMKEVREEKLSSRGNSQCKDTKAGACLIGHVCYVASVVFDSL